MNYIIALLLLISSTIALAGSVQSLRTDNDGNIVASVRGEESKTLSTIRSGTFTASYTNNNNTNTGSISGGKWVLYGDTFMIYTFSALVSVTSGTNIRTDFKVSSFVGLPIENVGTDVSSCTASGRGNISPFKATPIYIDSSASDLNVFLNPIDSAALPVLMPAITCLVIL